MQEEKQAPVVLVVEDQPQILALLEEFISDLGFGVLTDQSGATAEKISASNPNVIDLLITDIEMPGVDGGTKT
ncbi:MAG TPA: response regulator [Candidatus Angelobacter sp.]|jgi:CheY-like chemotaxis protein|nr:response regulator [Candidatus Angelobacter sp.]